MAAAGNATSGAGKDDPADNARQQIPFGRPMMGAEERAAIQEVLEGPILAHGPRVEAFETAFCERTGAPEAVAVSSCTAGMHLVWEAVGIGRGDEVVVPAQSHVATAHAVAYCGATPVFVDAEPKTGNLDVEAVAAAISPRTAGIAPVHFLGEPADMDEINRLAEQHGLFVLEDCALALGATRNGIHAGLWGDAGAFSFYPVKHVTTGEGGMVVTRDAELADQLRRRRAFGIDRSHRERSSPGSYDVVSLGYNYRMNELQAALGITQLTKLDDFLRRRRRNFQRLREGLAASSASVLHASENETRSSHYALAAVLSPEQAEHRAVVVDELMARGIGTSIYYPRPIPMMTHYQQTHGHRADEFPVASWLSSASIALPVGPHVSEHDIDRIGLEFCRALEKLPA